MGPHNGIQAVSTRGVPHKQSEVDVSEYSGCNFDEVFLTSLDCSYKIRPPGWWVLGVVPPMIKLGLFQRVKSGVPYLGIRASSLLLLK
ncbi:hypothetical protein BHE74_00015239 [Ensete ventricosum]|nr:hypothetical protein BHE74_00015239 [Ensete ventricosum]